MKTVNIHAAKTHLSRLIRDVLDGEEVVIAKNGVPMVSLVPVKERTPKRKPGFLKGLMTMSDDFDEPLADFEGYG